MNSEIENEEQTVTVELRRSGICICTMPKKQWDAVWNKRLVPGAAEPDDWMNAYVENSHAQDNLVYEMEQKYGTGDYGSEWKVVDVEESF